jgi:hypothetical protein
MERAITPNNERLRTLCIHSVFMYLLKVQQEQEEMRNWKIKRRKKKRVCLFLVEILAGVGQSAIGFVP